MISMICQFSQCLICIAPSVVLPEQGQVARFRSFLLAMKVGFHGGQTRKWTVGGFLPIPAENNTRMHVRF